MPHICIMKTGFEDTALAEKFGMPYVLMRNPRPYDTTTLNYNWQIWETKAFSLYTTTTEQINPVSARRGVRSVMNFLAAQGILRYRGHGGYLSRIVDDSALIPVRAAAAGLLEAAVAVEQEVKKGALLARILNPVDGELLARVTAPADGVVFFIDSGPLTYEHTAVFKLIPLE